MKERHDQTGAAHTQRVTWPMVLRRVDPLVIYPELSHDRCRALRGKRAFIEFYEGRFRQHDPGIPPISLRTAGTGPIL